MTTRVLLLGLRPDLIADIERQLEDPGLELHTGADLDDLRQVFGEVAIDHVFVGGGLDIDVRVQAVREVFRLSDRSTVHLKDQFSGPEAYAAFARSVLDGLRAYAPVESPNAILRATEASRPQRSER